MNKAVSSIGNSLRATFLGIVSICPFAPAQEPVTFPALAELEGVSHQQLIEVGNQRRTQFEKLNQHQRDAELAMREVLGDLAWLRSAEQRSSRGPAAVAAIRRRAQVDLERETYAGSSKDNPSAPAMSGVARRIDPLAIELRLWCASLLGVLEDASGRDELIGYWELSKAQVEFIESFLKGDTAQQSELVAGLENRLAGADDSAAIVPLIVIARNKLATSDALRAQINNLLVESKSPAAVAFLKQKDDSARASKTLRSVGQPLVVTGKLADGSEFSTEQLKGKVVLLDFWATWCGPCVAELPRLKDLYAKHHEKGFEIVGVCNDYSRDSLDRFLANDTQMNWRQLFDPAAAEAKQMNQVSRDLGVNMIPAYFVIDRKGVLRSVTARKDMETLIPSLLAEPVN